MIRQLSDYLPLVGYQVVDELHTLAHCLQGRSIQHVNSTPVGGGVAEILTRMVPLLNELGLVSTWNVIKGDSDFFQATKAMHNALHGKPGPFPEAMKKVFLETTELNRAALPCDADFVYIHDPQPIGLVQNRQGKPSHWMWRCHIDLSHPNPAYWEFLRPFVEQFDASVFSAPFFAQPISIRQFLICPSIDPLSDKNKDLPESVVAKTLERFQIDPHLPLITQISRFDYLKDPFGVVDAFRIVRKTHPCQLVLAGGGADDDPEGNKVLTELREKAGQDPDIHILALPPTSHIEVNALQRASTVVVQKSIQEGFGLTVSEALWKGKPVVASAVGGITLQIKHRVNGFLVHSVEGTAQAIKSLLSHPNVAHQMGENGREFVRNNFLLTRHIKEYLLLFLALDRNIRGMYTLS